jgi:hypothetical protein
MRHCHIAKVKALFVVAVVQLLVVLFTAAVLSLLSLQILTALANNSSKRTVSSSSSNGSCHVKMLYGINILNIGVMPCYTALDAGFGRQDSCCMCWYAIST